MSLVAFLWWREGLRLHHGWVEADVNFHSSPSSQNACNMLCSALSLSSSLAFVGWLEVGGVFVSVRAVYLAGGRGEAG